MIQVLYPLNFLDKLNNNFVVFCDPVLMVISNIVLCL